MNGWVIVLNPPSCNVNSWLRFRRHRQRGEHTFAWAAGVHREIATRESGWSAHLLLTYPALRWWCWFLPETQVRWINAGLPAQQEKSETELTASVLKKRSKTHKRLKERFLIGWNRTKRAKFTEDFRENLHVLTCLTCSYDKRCFSCLSHKVVPSSAYSPDKSTVYSLKSFS